MRRWPTTVAAVGFLVGASVHLAAFVLLGFGVELYGHGYPSWRHLAMASLDIAIGWVGMLRPVWLMAILPAYLAQRLALGVDMTTAFVAVAWLAIVVQRQMGAART